MKIMAVLLISDTELLKIINEYVQEDLGFTNIKFGYLGEMGDLPRFEIINIKADDNINYFIPELEFFSTAKFFDEFDIRMFFNQLAFDLKIPEGAIYIIDN